MTRNTRLGANAATSADADTVSELTESRLKLAAALRENETLRRTIGGDIAARKQVETSLAHERHLMVSLLNTLPDQIYFKDIHHRFLRVNPSFARARGLENPAELVGKSDADYFSAARSYRTAAIERQIMDSGEPVIDLEEIELRPDRPPTWHLTTKMPLRDAEGNIIGTFGVSRDITERKRIESQLHETSERFATAAESAGIGVWEHDVASNSLTWDDGMYRLYGVPRGTNPEPHALGVDSLHPEDRERCEAEMAAALRGDKEFDTEFRIVRPDGETRYLKAASRTLRALDGSALMVTGANVDVTERRRAELGLLEASSLLRTVLDSASEVSIIATDPNLAIKIFNAGAERLLGYASDEMIGRTMPDILHDRDELRVCGEELSAQFGHEVDSQAVLVEPSMLRRPREWTYVRKDGGRVTVSLVVTAMRTDAGELLGYVGVAHDVTRQKHYEASLRRAMGKAEQASGAKSIFLANMSHEIRTPMNAVIGLSYLLGQTSLNEEQTAFLRKIKLASKSLLAVITDVLDLSKIEAGELIVECAAFSLRDLLEEVGNVTGVQADAKGVSFKIDIPGDLPEALQGDATCLKQILTNLLSNAIRFTDRGGVELRVSRIAATATGVTLCFVVQDSGIGISLEAQTRLFAPFAQADPSITRRYGGTGLGLSIVKSLATLLGGEVTLNSVPGVGSEFTVVLEFALAAPDSLAAQQAAPAVPGARALLGVRVLVVDDSEINLDVAKRILELHGARVWLAANGQEAFDRLRLEPQAYDVVLMDVQMPVLDGYEATRRIRIELGLLGLPIIALTAGALSSERQRGAVAGMNDFITKPFDAEGLVVSILGHVRVAASQDETQFDAATVPPAGAAVPWPEIDGIDSTDVRPRFGNDVALFGSMLQRLLSEFAGLAIPAAMEERGALSISAARMHKLKGCAGMLGANSIHQLAGEAEAACVTGEAERAQRLAAALAAEIQRLLQSAAPLLEKLQAQAEAPAPALDEELQPRLLADLVDLLHQQSLSALDHFKSLSPQLRRILGEKSYELVHHHMDNLRFSDAVKALEEIQS
ncbi:MAG TPA: PAS domain S-box protein [Steroidobacteraceae bacterium]|nr:PAS domain S-box protein [Steroidobacteraceae bacterium]